MNVAQPATALTSPLIASILEVLVNTTRPLAGREIARLSAFGSQEGVRRALARLSEHGLVERTEHRGSTMYELNRDHLAMPVVNLLTEMRPNLIQKIREMVGLWSPQPIHLSMFGSAARADGGTRSDIDLLLIRPEEVDPFNESWNRQMNNLRESIQLWTGNQVAYIQYSERDFHELLVNRSEPFLEEWRKDAVDLGGVSARSAGRRI